MTRSSQVHGPALIGLGLTLVVAGLLPVLAGEGPEPAAADVVASEPAPEPSTDPNGQPTATPSLPPTRAAEPASPTPTASEEPPEAAAVTEADVVDFYARLTSALQASDVATLFDLLHPAVLERYGDEQCRSYLAGAGDETLDIEVLGSAPPEPWTWELDGASTEIDPAIAVDIRLSAGEASVEQEAHLAVADGRMRWFTDCGDPVS